MDSSDSPGKSGWHLSLNKAVGTVPDLPAGGKTRLNVWLPESAKPETPRIAPGVKDDSSRVPSKKKITKPKLTRSNKKRRDENMRSALLFVTYAPYTAINRLFFVKSGEINATGLHTAMKHAIQEKPEKYAQLGAAGGLLSFDCFQELIRKNLNRFETRDKFEQRHRKKSVPG